MDFGYKIKNTPEVKAEFGQMDLADFLSESQDILNFDLEPADFPFKQIHKGRNAKSPQSSPGRPEKIDPILGQNKQLALDLEKIYLTKDDELINKSSEKHGADVFEFGSAFKQSSLTHRSALLSQVQVQQASFNHRILQKSQAHNEALQKAVKNQD